MGDAAEDLIDNGLTILLLHQIGDCDNYCPYCNEEFELEQALKSLDRSGIWQALVMKKR